VQRESGKQTRGRPLFVGGLASGIVLISLLWWQWDNIAKVFESDETAQPAGLESTADKTAESPPVGAAPLTRSAAESVWEALTGSAPVWPGDPNTPGDCAQVEAELVQICAVFDSRDYVREAAPVGGACALLSEVAAALAQRPPEPSLELQSYQTILGNVFHMFRVVGRERMGVMRRVLREEQDLAEPLALALYRWVVSRESCARSGNTPIRRDALYEYAGFLFQTMGGQAYLRRRPPRVEALASLYALLVIDQAERDGNNPLGFDVLTEVGRTRELVDAQAFVFGDQYLELLNDIEHRQATRAGR